MTDVNSIYYGEYFTIYTGDPGSVPESGRSPGEGNGYPLQYSYTQGKII